MFVVSFFDDRAVMHKWVHLQLTHVTTYIPASDTCKLKYMYKKSYVGSEILVWEVS